MTDWNSEAVQALIDHAGAMLLTLEHQGEHTSMPRSQRNALYAAVDHLTIARQDLQNLKDQIDWHVG